MQTDLLITDFLMYLSSMRSISTYLNFLTEKGRVLSEINPGSDEIALTIEDALQALELIRNSEEIILGGDILSEDNNELIYAYQLWGEQYHVLNWCCDRTSNESKEAYLKRSYDIAKESITNANKIAENLKENAT